MITFRRIKRTDWCWYFHAEGTYNWLDRDGNCGGGWLAGLNGNLWWNLQINRLRQRSACIVDIDICRGDLIHVVERA
jgi:hypothetical protein